MRALRCSIAVVLFLSAIPVFAAEDVRPDYEQQVAPLLSKYCTGCHNASEKEGALSLESYAEMQMGGEHGPVFVAEDPAGSRMIRVLTGGEPKMPPEGEAQPTEAEVAVLRSWIEGGAKGPAGAEPDRTRLLVPKIESHSRQRPVTALDWSADGNRLAVVQDRQVELWTRQATGFQKASVLEGFPGKINSLHFATNPDRLVVASGIDGLFGEARIYDLKDNSLLSTCRGHRDILYDAELSPDGQMLATCSYDRKIILWNAQTSQPVRTLEGHNGAIYDIAFHPTLPILVSASADDTCKVWQTQTGERLDTLGQPLKEQYAVSFSPDGEQIVAAGADNRIRVWNLISREKPAINPLVIARFAHEGAITRLGWTSDGQQLVSVADDQTIKLWETKQFTEVKVFDPRTEVTAALSADPNVPHIIAPVAAPSSQEPNVKSAPLSVVAALAIGGEGKAFAVGRMNGAVEVYSLPASVSVSGPTTDAPAAVVAAAGMPDVPMTTGTEQEPNDAPAEALAITVPARVTGVIQAREGQTSDADLYRISAKAGQEWVIEIDAARSKSLLDSFVEVLTLQGKKIPQVQLQAVRDSYFTFRGKNADQPDDFRLFNWEEMDLNEYLYAGGEVCKLWLYPRGPDSGFKVYPGAGLRYGYFGTTPVVHALSEPCYIVRPSPPGTELTPNGLPVFTVYFQNDDASRRDLGTDSRLMFTAPADGDYLVRVRDVRGFQGDAFKYTLTVRPRQPDFKVLVHGANPAIAPGSAREFRVEAVRSDEFDGPIQVDITGLPPGFTATTPILIEEGQNNALGVITAAADAVAPMGDAGKQAKVTASAEIRGQRVTHDAGTLGEIKLGPKSKVLLRIAAVEGGARPVAAEPSQPLEFVIQPGETIMLKVVAERDGYAGNIPFGNEDCGRNLPFGVYVDNIGLNGLLMVPDTTEREFFVTAAKFVPDQSRLFHLRTTVEGEQATLPVLLHIRKLKSVAGP